MSIDKSLGEICEFKNSKRKPITASDRKAGPYPYYGAASIQDYVNDYLFDGLHVLVGEDGSVQTPAGRPMIQLVDKKFWVNNHAHILKCEDDLDTRYLAYALHEVWIVPFVTGAVQPKVNMGNLKRVLIKWPDKKIRNHIAKIGRSFDERITLLRETNVTLEAIVQALFKSWFMDFDPVRAKSEGKLPEGMDEATAALFPDSFEQSELGKIPKGWKIQSLNDIANYLNGLALQKFPPTGKDDLPVIKIAQLRKDNTIGADMAFNGIKEEYIIKDGDILFSWSGSLEVAIWCGGIGALNQHLFKVSSDYYQKWFYYLWTKHHLEKFRQIAASKATTMGHIQRHHLVEAKVIIPNKNILNIADKIFTPLLDKIILNSIQIRNLSNIRDILLPRLISGQITLPEVKEEINSQTKVNVQ